MSIAASASVAIPPGPAEADAARSLAATRSWHSGSSPLISSPNSSTVAFRARMILPPKPVTPIPSTPSSVSTCTVTYSRIIEAATGAPTSGSSAGRRTTLVLTCWIFISSSFDSYPR